VIESLDIVRVVEPHVVLKRAGRELVGLCPLHSEKTPSFSVNPDKNLFFCHGCHEGGDAVAFVEKLHGCSFREALALLGLGGDRKPPPPSPQAVRRKDKAREVARWQRETSNRLRERLRDIDERRWAVRLVMKVSSTERAFFAEEDERLKREWDILSDLDDDLFPWRFEEFPPESWEERGKAGTWVRDAKALMHLYEARAFIERLLEERW
jgi:DNA primase